MEAFSLFSWTYFALRACKRTADKRTPRAEHRRFSSQTTSRVNRGSHGAGRATELEPAGSPEDRRAEAAGGDCGVAAGEIGARQEIQPVSLSRLAPGASPLDWLFTGADGLARLLTGA